MTPVLPTHSIDVNKLIDSRGINKEYLEEILVSNPTSRISNVTTYMTQDSRKHEFEHVNPLQIKGLLSRDIDAIKELTTERVKYDLKELTTELANSGNLEQPWNFKISLVPLLNDNFFICDWLTRVESQFDPKTPQKIKEADLKYAKENLQRGRIFTALLPGMQTVEGAKNYLLKTMKVIIDFKDLDQVAQMQLDIDKKSLSKERGYKNAMLASLIGTITIAAGSVTMNWLVKVGKIAVIAGVVINTIAALYATYNYWVHRNDEADGKKELKKFQGLISKSLRIYKEKLEPEVYDESQAIFRQRGDSLDFLLFDGI
ncbi:hypothetical protein [Candidatus Rhabdochlamydia sp. T3358]|uniref:hypothetical protein n=1 Tax=Candidatus Rhabdochlamydia sp. T3358 TaxID=2099795 RepID=UPI0010B43F7B|nr:hypothetical protein [Candidatus Rhabdochlamydia sp. T3358]VHO04428.1 hypothetical protein RHT_01390 [Candidatus Rhabdochlamydia sp. T3358]